MRTKDKKETFIEKARKIHTNKYDYSKVLYKDCNSKIIIICPEHGEFIQTPRSHIRGSGCPICANKISASNKRKNLSQLIVEFNKKHNNKYKYDSIKEDDYKNNKSKIPIICPIHGIFFQSVSKHLNGQGCPKCYGNTKKTTDDFINEAIQIHNNEYDYSKVKYEGINHKVEIICNKHGSFFQTPKNHLRGQGCPECAKSKISKSITKPFNQFITEANITHNNKYSYIKEKYINASSTIEIVCPIHGAFKQIASSHLQGCGCPECAKIQMWDKRGRMTIETFIAKANQIHDNFYDYSEVKFINNKTKVNIICPIHGKFKQTPDKHLYNKCGCPKCANTYQPTTKEFIIKANIVHDNKYDYSKTEYINAHTKICIICPEHGEFWQIANDHIIGKGCPKCSHKYSKPENTIINYIETFYNDEILNNIRSIIPPYELDIFIPKLKIAIEYNGLRWHSEQFNKDRNYHLNKLILCNEQGIKLIQVFEDEWLDNKEIVLSKIKHLLGKDDNLSKIQARKCDIKEIDKDTSRKFLDKNHIQGFSSSTIYLGCFYSDELVGVMSFKKENKDKNNHTWELTRFATNINKHCIGIGGKLFKYFIKNYNPEYIKSFADRRWTLDKDNNLYTKLGFKLGEVLKPEYRYINDNKREHKFGFRKKILLRKYPDAGLTEDMTEKQMTEKLGFYRIWDCGLIKYEWKSD